MAEIVKKICRGAPYFVFYGILTTYATTPYPTLCAFMYSKYAPPENHFKVKRQGEYNKGNDTFPNLIQLHLTSQNRLIV